eukprot:scaffold31026_cov29-Phaeocystis_antarctica.AAC.1
MDKSQPSDEARTELSPVDTLQRLRQASLQHSVVVEDNSSTRPALHGPTCSAACPGVTWAASPRQRQATSYSGKQGPALRPRGRPSDLRPARAPESRATWPARAPEPGHVAGQSRMAESRATVAYRNQGPALRPQAGQSPGEPGHSCAAHQGASCSAPTLWGHLVGHLVLWCGPHTLCYARPRQPIDDGQRTDAAAAARGRAAPAACVAMWKQAGSAFGHLWLSGGCAIKQLQTTPWAAPSFSQPRPDSRLGPAGLAGRIGLDLDIGAWLSEFEPVATKSGGPGVAGLFAQ